MSAAPLANRLAARRGWAFGLALAALLAAQFPPPALCATIVESRVATSSDDAEEPVGATSVNLSSSDLELIRDGSTDQTVGMRWTGLAIPRGATISRAYIQFSAKEAYSNPVSVTFRAQADDNAPTFTSAAGNITSRPLTGAAVGWSPPEWILGDTGPAQQTPDLSTVIQEIVNRGGWNSGNALVIVVTGSGKRTAWAFNGNAALAPLLHIEYGGGSPPPTDAAPVARLSVAQIASPALTVTADGSASTDTDSTPIASYRFDFGDGTTVTTTAPIATANHTYAAANTYTVTLTATDTGGLTSAPVTRSVTVTAPTGGSTIERRTVASSDDAEEPVGGSVSLSSSDLELIHDGVDQTVGMRWTGLAIPRGATISRAYIQFSAKESRADAVNLSFRGQADDNPPTFTSAVGDISARPLTGTAAGWSPAEWIAGDTGPAQQTPDLSGVIQEIVNRGGWASGNALVIVVTGSGRRTAWAYNGDAALSPLLHIEYGGGSPPPPGDAAPVARLSVAQIASPPLTVTANGSASTDTDATPIASYRFNWGDGSTPTTTTAPTATANHTYASANTYTVTLTATDTGGLTSAPATASVTVTGGSSSGGVAVYAGYYDTHHPNVLRAKPSPWRGGTNVTFVGSPDPGTSNDWDSSALRIDNLGSSAITVSAYVDMGTKTFSLWGSAKTLDPGKILIFAQTGFENFDGSDTSPAGCYGCNPKLCLSSVNTFKPVVRLTINGVATNYIDTGQILNTHGVDMAGCPYTGTRNDESQSWTRIYPGSVATGPASASAATAEASMQRLTFAAPSPNPSRGDFYIRFITPQRGPVRLSLYDPMGRLVRTYLDEELGAGEYRGRMMLPDETPGIYYLRLWTPQETVSRQIVVIR